MDETQEIEWKFGQIAAVLATCKFSTPLSEQEVRTCSHLEQGILKPKTAYKFGERWFVKYYLGGKQRTWANYHHSDFELAFRLSDMIRVRFWNKRVKLAGILDDDAVNISVERARLDLANEGEIISLLIQMEQLLPEKEARRGIRKGQLLKTARQEFLDVETRLSNQFIDAVKAIRDEIALLRNEVRASRHALDTGPVAYQPPTVIPPQPGYVAPQIGDPVLPSVTCKNLTVE